jgi:hypothetical protein
MMMWDVGFFDLRFYDVGFGDGGFDLLEGISHLIDNR